MKTEKSNRIYKTIMLVLLTAIITFIITSISMYNVLGKKTIKTLTNSSSIESTFNNFKKFIEKKYIGTIDEEKMLESAIKGYVEGLDDEYSEYITKEEMKEYMEYIYLTIRKLIKL